MSTEIVLDDLAESYPEHSAGEVELYGDIRVPYFFEDDVLVFNVTDDLVEKEPLLHKCLIVAICYKLGLTVADLDDKYTIEILVFEVEKDDPSVFRGFFSVSRIEVERCCENGFKTKVIALSETPQELTSECKETYLDSNNRVRANL